VMPRMQITAARHDSGKSTLATAGVHLGDRMIRMSSPRPANIYRATEAFGSGFFLDEAHKWFARSEDMQDVINSGFDRDGAYVMRIEDAGRGDKRRLEPRMFSTFTPIHTVGIRLEKVIPEDTMSRSLVLRLRPARPGEVPEELLGRHNAVAALRVLAGRIKRWVRDNDMALDAAEPSMPPGLLNRLKMIWRPLLAIADKPGGRWPRLAREALATDRTRACDLGLGVQMLLDVHDLITASGQPAMHTRDLIEKLLGLELRSWSTYGRARVAIRDIDVASLLDPFEVRPIQIKIAGNNLRGYRLEDIAAAVARYTSQSDRDEVKTRYPATDGGGANSDLGESGSGGGATSDATLQGPLPDGDFRYQGNGGDEKGATGFPEENQSGSGVAASTTGISEDENSGDGGPGAETGPTTIACETCGGEFPRPARGRPPRRCPECRKRPPRVEPGVIFE
jgi:hypothetical protein